MIADKLREFGMEAFSFNTDEYDSIGLNKYFWLIKLNAQSFIVAYNNMREHYLKISTKDSLVENEFRLNRPDSRAVLIISRPDFFEKCVVPFIKQNSNNLQDPIDASAKSQIENLFNGKEIIFDYELHPNRRPKILMQTGKIIFSTKRLSITRKFVRTRVTNKVITVSVGPRKFPDMG